MVDLTPASKSAPAVPPKMMSSLKVTDDSVLVINQLLLPHVIQWDPVHTIEDAFDSIKQMRIRGAPAIASLAALTVSLVLTRRLLNPLDASTDPATTSAHASAYHVPALDSPETLKNWLLPVLDYLESSRPTAVNLQEGMDRIRKTVKSSATSAEGSSQAQAKALAEEVVKTCQNIEKEDLERCKEMSRIGAEWLVEKIKREKGKDKLKVMTVCNTGSLATSGYGTALGVITALHETGHLDRAYYTQSTPYHQGSRLTSLELSTLQIPSCMICDTMVGSLFQHEDVDAVIVGADRIVKNGDTANKIGTYQAASLAKMHGIDFMVIAPVTTLDLTKATGKEIHIEQRPAVEATQARGLDPLTGSQVIVQITPDGIGSGSEEWQKVYNPSFDVTPSKLISCIVTEKGVAVNQGGEHGIDLSGVC